MTVFNGKFSIGTDSVNSFSNLSGKVTEIKSTLPITPTPTNPSFGSVAFGNTTDTLTSNSLMHSTTATSGASSSYTLNFEPNILDYYDTYTYHWKLFITPLSAAYEGTVLAPEIQSIIAESGVSDLTIDDVEIHGIATPSVETGTGTQTHVKFKIVEPSGAGLLDKMFYQAVSLGIGNWLVMPCFLQLEFRARDPDTAESVTNGAPDGLGAKRWVWPVKITNAKANVTTVGTRYEFDAIMYDELAQSNSYFAIQHNVSLNNLTKFKNAIDDLQDKLNADQYEKLIDNYSIPDTYRFVIDPKLEDIDIAYPDKNKHTARNSDFIDFEKKSATYNTGTSIDKIVDSLLLSSKYFQKKLQSAKTPSSDPDSANDATPMRPLWRIVTETRPVAFDMLRQDNAVEITIFIVEYDLGLVETDPSQTGQTAATKLAADKRLAAYTEKKILKKKYNYIFTGLNDQVIQFDLNLNFSFAAALSRFGGIFYDSATQEKGVVQNNTAEQEKKAAEEVRQTLQFINNASRNDNIDEKIDATKKKIAAAELRPETKRLYTRLLDNAKPAQKTAFTQQIQQAGGLDADGELNKSRIEATSIAQPAGNSNLTFISDVNINSATAQTAYQKAIASRKGKLRPIPYRETAQEQNAAYGIDPTSDAGRARTASVFSTALYSTLDASLQAIKITVKGDPFWLFPGTISADATAIPYKAKMSKSEAIRKIKEAQILDPNSVNMFGTDNFIVIRFRTPRIYNDVETDDRVDPYTEVQAFSGVYKVVTVTSKFAEGKFTQELFCILDPLIDLADYPDLLRDIETSVQQPDPAMVTPNQGIPKKVISTDRILGLTDLPKGVVNTARSTITGQVTDAKAQVLGPVNAALSNIPPLPSSSTDFLAKFLPPKIG